MINTGEGANRAVDRVGAPTAQAHRPTVIALMAVCQEVAEVGASHRVVDRVVGQQSDVSLEVDDGQERLARHQDHAS